MILKIKGDPDVVNGKRELVCSINGAKPFSAAYPHLASKLGRRSLQGLEIWASLVNGKLTRIESTVSPESYGMRDLECVYIRGHPVPECPISSSKVIDDANFIKQMEWSRTARILEVQKPKPSLKINKKKSSPTPTQTTPTTTSGFLPKKNYKRRLTSSPSTEQQIRSLFHYSFSLNDSMFSKDFSQNLFTEVVNLHLKGRLSSKHVPNEAFGGSYCWTTGEQHSYIKKYDLEKKSTPPTLLISLF